MFLLNQMFCIISSYYYYPETKPHALRSQSTAISDTQDQLRMK